MPLIVYQVRRPKKHYGFWRFVLDLLLIFATSGIWFLWMVFRFLRSN